LTMSASALSPVLAINNWYHIAAVREGVACALYIEGVRVAYDATFFLNRGPVRSDGNIKLCIGRRFVVSGATRLAPLHGWLDEIRILNGTAAYDTSSASYTVPTEPFPRDPPPEAAPAIPPPPSPQSPLPPAAAPSNWQPSNL